MDFNNEIQIHHFANVRYFVVLLFLDLDTFMPLLRISINVYFILLTSINFQLPLYSHIPWSYIKLRWKKKKTNLFVSALSIITHVVYNKCHSSIFTSYKFLYPAFCMSSEEKGNLLYAFASITSIRLYISHMMCHVHHVHNAVDGFN